MHMTYNMITYVDIINVQKLVIHKLLNYVYKYMKQIYISFCLTKFGFINEHE